MIRILSQIRFWSKVVLIRNTDCGRYWIQQWISASRELYLTTKEPPHLLSYIVPLIYIHITFLLFLINQSSPLMVFVLYIKQFVCKNPRKYDSSLLIQT